MSVVDANKTLGQQVGIASTLSRKLDDVCEYLKLKPLGALESPFGIKSEREKSGQWNAKDLVVMLGPSRQSLFVMSFALGVGFQTRFVYRCLGRMLHIDTAQDDPTAEELEHMRNLLQDFVTSFDELATNRVALEDMPALRARLMPFADAVRDEARALEIFYRELEATSHVAS